MSELLTTLAENYQQIIAVGVTAIVFILLQTRRTASIDFLFLGGLLVVTLTGVITPQEAFSGFANTAVLTIGALLAVTAALRSCGVLDWVGTQLLGTAKTERAGLLRLIAALIPSSAFVLNTALVAMMVPVVMDWCRKRNIAPSRMLIPVSYLTILGGVCTLIGTSTTLVVNAQLATEHRKLVQHFEANPEKTSANPLATDDKAAGDANATVGGESNVVIAALSGLDADDRNERIRNVRPMSLLEIGKVGLPAALVGSVLLFLIAPKLLPKRLDLVDQLGDHRREYLVEMQVQPECRLIGKTVENAGLRHLPGLFLIEIDRDGQVIGPVSPDDIIKAGDRLIFTGVVETIVDLEKIPGLVPAVDLAYEIHPQKRQSRHLSEVVLSRTSPLIRSTIKEANFRKLYGAAVVAVHRNGVRVTSKLGDIVLQPGDTLLLQTRPEFISLNRNSRDFYLVSAVEGSQPRQHHKLGLAALIMVLMLGWMIVASFTPDSSMGWKSPAVIAFVAVATLIVTGCLRVAEARQSIDLQLLVTIASALGLGLALDNSGAAGSIAQGITEVVTSAFGRNKYLMLITIYVLTMILTEMISNTAVAAIMLPIAINVAMINDYNPRTFIVGVSLAASLAFITPIGYQTNLMVMGPGSYRPVDYVRCGLPLSLTVATTALILLPIIWPL